jgi:hypothetical protein
LVRLRDESRDGWFGSFLQANLEAAERLYWNGNGRKSKTRKTCLRTHVVGKTNAQARWDGDGTWETPPAGARDRQRGW